MMPLDRPQRRHRARTDKRRGAGTHLVQHAPKAEQVGAVIDRATLGLLRRHVGRRACDRPDLRQPHVGVGDPGQPEIQDLHPEARGRRFEPDVLRLDVAVHHALLVGGPQARGNLAGDGHSLAGRQLAVAFQPGAERLAVQQLHGQVRRAAVLAHLVDRDDMVVLDRRRRPSLAQEPCPRRLAGRLRRLHHLQRHAPLELRVDGLQHHAHAAAAENPPDAIGPDPPQLVRLLRRIHELGQLRAQRRSPLAGDRIERGVKDLVKPVDQALDPLFFHALGRNHPGRGRLDQRVFGLDGSQHPAAVLAVRDVLLEAVCVLHGELPEQEELERRSIGTSLLTGRHAITLRWVRGR